MEPVNNVLMISPTPFFSDRGCHIRILNSYYRLAMNNIGAVVVTYPLGRDINGVAIERVMKLPGYSKKSPGFSYYKPLLDFLILVKSFMKLKRSTYSYLYCHLHEGALIGILLKPFFKKRIVFDCQGSLTGELLSGKSQIAVRIFKKPLFFLEKWIVKRCDEIIVSNKTIERLIIDTFAYNKEVTFLPDYPDPRIYNKSVRAIQLPKLPGDFFVVYLGGLNKNKGVDYLLEAIPFTDKNIHFLIFGYPLDYIKNRINELSIQDRIYLQGPVPYEESAKYIAAGNIAVSPKMTDETGEANAKIYSYMALGLKVICFDTSENHRIVGDQGYYAKPGDVMDLAEKISESYQENK